MVELEIWLDRFFLLPESVSDVGTIKGLMARSAVVYWQKKPDVAVDGYMDAAARARRLDDEQLLAEALYGLATSLIVAQRTDEATEPLQEARSIFTRLGDQSGLADVTAAEAFASLNTGGWADAGPKFREAGEIYEKVGRRTQAAQAIYAQAEAELAAGRLAEARDFAVEAIQRGLELSDVFLQVWGLEYVARIELDMGNTEFAGLLAGAAAAASKRIGGGWSPETIGLEDSTKKLTRQLGEAETAKLLEPGRSLTLEGAVARAIGEGE
jgi:tetratricopeptide (TPR) repeat protein